LKDRRSKNNKVSRGMWKAVETKAGEVGWQKQNEEEAKEECYKMRKCGQTLVL